VTVSDITFVPRDLTSNPGISYDVVGLGNALVDVIAQTDDAFLEQQQLAKGSMALVDTDRAVSLYEALQGGVEMSGGSAANTMCGIASFGGRAAFIGKVAQDALGDTFSKDMQVVGVDFKRPASGNSVPTGRCIIAVTPDAQRTMNTFLGISSLLTPADLDAAAIAAGAVLYLEGYLYDQPEAKVAFRAAAEIAHKHNRQVSLTLSDSFCVDRHRSDFRALISDEIDILFGNEAELLALYETDTFEFAVTRLRQDCIVAAITRSELGSVVVTKDGVVEVAAQPVAQVVETTGAGDLYAAGFLYGYTRGMDLHTCATLGHIASAEVISHVGPRPQIALSSLLPAQ
jgi:sugar/nucleoside kinase (ribokinase family)